MLPETRLQQVMLLGICFSELNEAQMLVDVAVFALFGVGDDAPSHCSGYLPTQYVDPVGSGNHHVCVLVFFACLGQPGLVEVAVEVLDELHAAINGEPVGVYVPQTHKDAHHDTAVVEVPVLVDLLDNDNLSVGRSNHNALRIVGSEVAYRTSVEVGYYGIDGSEDSNENGKWYLRVERIPENECQSHKQYASVE